MINHLMVVHIQKHESCANEKNIMLSNTFSIIRPNTIATVPKVT